MRSDQASVAGRQFRSLEQRMIHVFISTTPELIAADPSTIPYSQQQQLYDFLVSALHVLYEDPSILNLSATPDAYFPDFSLNKTNPTLHKSMVKTLKKMEQMSSRIADIARFGQIEGKVLRVPDAAVRMPKGTLAVLTRIGLQSAFENGNTLYRCPRYPEIFPALKYLSEKISAISDKFVSSTAFWNCYLTDNTTEFCRGIYNRLLGKHNEYQELMKYLKAHGYREHGEMDRTWRMDFIKNNGKPQLKICSPGAAKNYWGLSFWYDYRWKSPVSIALRLPKYKEILLEFDNLPAEMQNIIVRHTKPCDSCGYCTQTDRTKTRKKLAISVNYGKGRALCPLYPIWGYQTTRFDREVIKWIETILDSVNQIYTQKAI